MAASHSPGVNVTDTVNVHYTVSCIMFPDDGAPRCGKLESGSTLIGLNDKLDSPLQSYLKSVIRVNPAVPDIHSWLQSRTTLMNAFRRRSSRKYEFKT